MHSPGHFGFRETLLLHGGFDLEGDNALDLRGANFLVDAFLAEKAIEMRCILLPILCFIT